MTAELIRERSEIMNTEVIARDSGRRIGVVKELLVDIDRREVVALGLRDNIIAVAGMPRYMLLSSIRQVGDVILVDDEDVIEDVDVEAYSKVVGSEVITETGELLGRARDFKFNLEDGKLEALIIASLGLPQIPDRLISTYELPIDEIASSGTDRIIVFEGAQERLVQLTVGLLEQLGIGRPPWERDEEEAYYTPAARPENQLPTGIPVNTPISRPVQQATPIEEAWEDEWQEPEPVEPLRRQMPEPRYAEAELEENNWGDEEWVDAPSRPLPPEEPVYRAEPYSAREYDEYEVEGDAWEDEVEPRSYREAEPYQPPRVNIPEKTKAPEYEEEPGY